ncbi:ATP-dependent Lhr-like helicase [Sphingobium sp. B2D3A]|uniref:DEAD/DEAH box helicase n=1 Tax=unclassified Sphingobium TaxID=2611147 RepID=UPI002225764C|nr:MULTISPECIES: DEAD/DEAH box helicase [unclassified Sphingobium]MCW2338217.1 ATP-dependent Lhr-like helicase [Sphingobium sp. B2D3A]MCW2384675.1 ATP-dependent Lhr-like helicase [Sphingobium sp. B2D3D]
MESYSAFSDLYPAPIIDWVQAKGWTGFREIQKLAIANIPIDQASPLSDVILEAETSSGKTEAAFLPLIARHLLADPKPKGFVIVYVSPLKALINDAQIRLESLGAAADLGVYRWHSESEADKDKARKAAASILLTTPESIEGFLVRAISKPTELAALTSAQAIVVDELHAYFDTARGRHLQSLLHRLDLHAGRKIPRIGLSATLGNIDKEASDALRPKAVDPAKVIRSSGAEAKPVKVAVKVFVDSAEAGLEGEAVRKPLPERIAEELLADLGNASRSLVFANARATVETVFEALSKRAPEGQPFEVARHHSSVPKKERETIEKKMRAEPGIDDAPASMVTICTNTLELGIDIGKVERVIQIDPTYSVSALRQRVGRSGRRDDMTAEGLIYVMENALSETTHPLEQLRLRTIQAAATAQLSLEAAFEVPNPRNLQVSTLYHQVLSMLHEHGECTTQALHEALVTTGPWESDGPFGALPFFERFIEAMEEVRKPQVARVGKDGPWRSAEGQTLRNHPYAIFSTPAEYVVTHGTKVIGRLPVTVAYRIGETFVLNAGRWRVTSVNEARHTITVARAPSAGAPRYGGPAQTPSGLVTQRVQEILAGRSISDVAGDEVVEAVVDEGRSAYQTLGLSGTRFIPWGRDTLIFPWVGARLTETLVLLLRREGLRANGSSFAITVEDEGATAIKLALSAVKPDEIDLEELAREARRLQQDRFDRLLIPYYLRLGYARRGLTLNGFTQLLNDLKTDPAAPDMKD